MIGPQPARRFAITWIALVLATIASWEVPQALALTAPLVLGVASLKIMLIGLEFMELRLAPRWFRMLFVGWAAAIGLALMIFLFA